MARKQTYAYLGPAGTFSHKALLTFVERGLLAEEFDALPCENMPAIFEAVDRGVADFGVVPIENSLEGSVTAVLDAFAFTSRAEILGECVLDIHQALILAPGATLEGVRKVASHQQGIGQCRHWLSKNLPEAEVCYASSTAAAVPMAMADPSVAAIASPLAAELAGAVVYEEAIEDHVSSQTRFVLIGQAGSTPAAHEEVPGKTTLALFMGTDRPGVLHMILSEFTYAGVNLTMIQSRPTKRELGSYMFFVDADGWASEPALRTALDCLRMKLREVKIIGSYPRSV